MMITRRTTLMAGVLGLFLLSIAAGQGMAISLDQVDYDDSVLWVQGNHITYSIRFRNQGDPSVKNTTEMSAMVRYDIGAITGNDAVVTETIYDFKIEYKNNFSSPYNSPFLAIYNSTVSMADFRQDMIYETSGDSEFTEFFVANHTDDIVPITDLTLFTIGNITNVVTYHKTDNTITPSGIVKNRFIVSSNITGNESTVEANGMTRVDRMLRFGMLYTPLAFAGQNGTFWFDLSKNLSNTNNFGLWSDVVLDDGSTLYMTFRENETYTYEIGHPEGEGAFRWRTQFRKDYPKLGTGERAYYDSETGLLLEYWHEPTIWEAKVGDQYYSRQKYHRLEIKLVDASFALEGNATPEIPGFPPSLLLISAGFVVLWMASRMLRRRSKSFGKN